MEPRTEVCSRHPSSPSSSFVVVLRPRARSARPKNDDEAKRALPRLRQVEKYDVRWITDRSVMASEGEFAVLAIDSEHCHVVPSLVAHIKELTGGIEIEAARIVST